VFVPFKATATSQRILVRLQEDGEGEGEGGHPVVSKMSAMLTCLDASITVKMTHAKLCPDLLSACCSVNKFI
jgi:hypothetical protein